MTSHADRLRRQTEFLDDFFFTARRVGRQTQKRPNIITMLGREKDVIFVYLEAQSGKIEKREP